MEETKILNESAKADEVKWELIDYLGEEGYATYARRLKAYKFIIADMYHGHHIAVAAMFPKTNEIVINPSMLDEEKLRITIIDSRLPWEIRTKAYNDHRELYQKKMEQLSVLIRHELLHFLLVHEKRLLDLLAQKHPEWKKLFSLPVIYDIANYAEDYEISIEGYDDHDKEIVRLMTLNNTVVGGLLAEDDHPDWGKKTMEEMLEILMKEAEQAKQNHKPKTVIEVHKVTHSPEYAQTYNQILALLDDTKYSDADLANILAAAENDDDVLDILNGNLLLAKGE